MGKGAKKNNNNKKKAKKGTRYQPPQPNIDEAFPLSRPQALGQAEALQKRGNELRKEEKPQEALESYKQAVSVLNEAFGADNVYVGSLDLNLANLHHQLGDLTQAQAHFEHALLVFRSHGKDPLMQGKLQLSLGDIARDQGRLEDALALYGQARATFEQEKGTQPCIETTLAIVNQAVLLQRLGEWQRALDLNEEALVLYRELFGDDSIQVGGLSSSIGELHQLLGHTEKAVRVYEQVLQIYERTGHGTAMEVAIIGMKLAALALEKQERRQALHYNEMALSALLAHPTQSQRAAALRLDIGKMYKDEGDLDLAAKHYGEALKTYQRAGQQKLEAALVHLRLGEVQVAQDKCPQAEVQYKEALRILRKEHGEKSKETCAPLLSLANLKRSQKAHVEAHGYYKQVLELNKKYHGPQSAETANMFVMCGDMLLFQNKVEDSALQYEKACEINLLRCPASQQETAQEKWTQAQAHKNDPMAIVDTIKLYREILTLCEAE